jgi:hypothetical protein
MFHISSSIHPQQLHALVNPSKGRITTIERTLSLPTFTHNAPIVCLVKCVRVRPMNDLELIQFYLLDATILTLWKITHTKARKDKS